MGVNNLPKIVTWQCSSQKSTSDHPVVTPMP